MGHWGSDPSWLPPISCFQGNLLREVRPNKWSLVNPRQSKAPGAGIRGRSIVTQLRGAPWGITEVAGQVLEGSDFVVMHRDGRHKTRVPQSHEGHFRFCRGKIVLHGSPGKEKKEKIRLYLPRPQINSALLQIILSHSLSYSEVRCVFFCWIKRD